MKKETLTLIRIVMVVICCAYCHIIMSQPPPAAWKKEIEYAIKNPNKISNDSSQLYLTKYTYIGVISSEAKKLELISQLLDKDAPTILIYPPVITKDTVIIGDSCIIKKKSHPVFKVITIAEMRDIIKSAGLEDPTIQAREKLGELIKIGYEYIELEWNYNNNKIQNICIVSNENGVIYDNIGSIIISGCETTIRVSKSQKEVDDNKIVNF